MQEKREGTTVNSKSGLAPVSSTLYGTKASHDMYIMYLLVHVKGAKAFHINNIIRFAISIHTAAIHAAAIHAAAIHEAAIHAAAIHTIKTSNDQAIRRQCGASCAMPNDQIGKMRVRTWNIGKDGDLNAEIL